MTYTETNGKDSVLFIDEESYTQLQADHPPESLAEINSAVDPETGEINWDCPCLGGMAQPPCGSFFKEAFTCFLTSTEEPKGIDCVENFRAMQDCMRQFPEIYADQLDDEDKEKVDKEDKEEVKENEETSTPTDSEFTQVSDENSPLIDEETDKQ